MAKKGKRGRDVPSEVRCAVIDGVCPGNGDPAKGRYCPHWTMEPEKNDETQEVRVNEGCDIPMMRNWQIDAMRAGWVSAQFVSRLGTPQMQRLLGVITAVADEEEKRRLEAETAPLKLAGGGA